MKGSTHPRTNRVERQSLDASRLGLELGQHDCWVIMTAVSLSHGRASGRERIDIIYLEVGIVISVALWTFLELGAIRRAISTTGALSRHVIPCYTKPSIRSTK